MGENFTEDTLSKGGDESSICSAGNYGQPRASRKAKSKHTSHNLFLDVLWVGRKG